MPQQPPCSAAPGAWGRSPKNSPGRLPSCVRSASRTGIGSTIPTCVCPCTWGQLTGRNPCTPGRPGTVHSSRSRGPERSSYRSQTASLSCGLSRASRRTGRSRRRDLLPAEDRLDERASMAGRAVAVAEIAADRRKKRPGGSPPAPPYIRCLKGVPDASVERCRRGPPLLVLLVVRLFDLVTP